MLLLNPVAPLLEGLSATVVHHRPPDLPWVVYSAAFAIGGYCWPLCRASSASNPTSRRASDLPMTDVVLAMDRVSKKFRKGEPYDSLRDFVPALVGACMHPQAGGRAGRARVLGAPGRVLRGAVAARRSGIIGANGAGKSTILKLLSGIMQPTSGTMTVRGRLSALIEVGAGFHPDLTGRENIYLNGTILGMSREEIRRKFDEIVAFSELDEFIDTPVKRYSSGMFARLGFSVAAHVEPDVLIVDEVLSVGDYVFQQKCQQKMRAILGGGATVIFVSHNLHTVAELCDSAILLERGRVLESGPAAARGPDISRPGAQATGRPRRSRGPDLKGDCAWRGRNGRSRFRRANEPGSISR